jgi:hypothetical protein
VSAWPALALALFAAAAPAAVAAPARDAMSLGFFKRATAQGGEAGSEAQRYVEGTFHGMLLLSDALQRDGRPVFCADGANTESRDLELDRLGAGFRAWLANGQASDSDLPEMQPAPIAMFVLSYLSTTLPCAPATPMAAPEGEEDALAPVLEQALPR